MKIKSYNSKIIEYDDGSATIINYDENIQKGFKFRSRNEGRVSFDSLQNDETKEFRTDSIYRTRKLLFEYGRNHTFDFLDGCFVTLTFADNVTDPKITNKYFNSWRTSFVRKLKKHYDVDLKYIGIPEFQKRGAVHYHLILNINPRDHSELLPLQKGKFNMYDVFGWNHGFTSVFDFDLTDENFNPILYVSKYLTKDLDNRLLGATKLLKSNNLTKPTIFELDIKNEDDNHVYQEYIDYVYKLKSECSESFEIKAKNVSPVRRYAISFWSCDLTLTKPKKI